VTDVVFYFQVHQPHRLRHYTFFDIGRSHEYWDYEGNRRILSRVAHKCYLPMNQLLLQLIQAHAGAFRIAFSVSGTALEQFEWWAPEVLDSFRRLADTGCVEFLCETSHHSLASLYDLDEFEAQVRDQMGRIRHAVGVPPGAFRNTELVLDNRIAQRVEAMGFAAALGEGADRLLGWRSPHRVYRALGTEKLALLLRSYRLSDDIAFRFSNRGWSEWPLTSQRFADWLHALPPEDQVVGLFMDYETFGEHQWADTGIFEFMRHLPGDLLRRGRFRFQTPSEVAGRNHPVATLDLSGPVSWADTERDLTAWLGNDMQRAAADALYALLPDLRRAEDEGRFDLLEEWRRLTTSDHLYYMCTKWFSDGDVHKYFSPYANPHEAFVTFMNVLDDLSRRVLGAARQPALPGTLRAG
jgi:alpha-amylase